MGARVELYTELKIEVIVKMQKKKWGEGSNPGGYGWGSG